MSFSSMDAMAASSAPSFAAGNGSAGSPSWPNAPAAPGGIRLATFAALWALAWCLAGIYAPWRLGASLLSMAGPVVVGLAVVRHWRLGVFTPFALFLASGLLYTVPTALTLWLEAVLVTDREVPEAALHNAAWLSAWGLAAASLAYTLTRAHGVPGRPFRGLLVRYDRVSADLVAWVLIAAGSAALFILVFVLLGVGSLQAAQYGERYLMLRGLGPFLLGIPAATLGGGLLYMNRLRAGHHVRALVVLALLLGALAAWTGMMETRAALVQAVLMIMVIRQCSGRPVRVVTLVAMGVLLLFLGIFISMRRALRADFQVDLDAVPGWVFNPANSEFGAAQVTIADLTGRVPAHAPHRYGSTYLALPAIVVPLAVWPDRPHAPGEWYASTFYPDDWARGGAFAFSPVAEAYLNLGLSGVLLVFTFFGWALCRLERRLEAHAVLPGWITVTYALGVPFLVTFFRLDMASLVKGYFVLSLLPVLLAVVGAHLISLPARLSAVLARR